MARYAIIDNGAVANVIEAEEEFATAQGWVLAGNGGIGDLYENGEFVKPPEPMPTLEYYEAALDAWLDAKARMYRYDNRFTFALRAGYPGPYHDEAVTFAEWMDECNAQAFALLQSVLDGEAAIPTIEDFISGLPALELP